MVFLLNKTLNYSIAEPEHIINIIRNDESFEMHYINVARVLD